MGMRTWIRKAKDKNEWTGLMGFDVNDDDHYSKILRLKYCRVIQMNSLKL